MPDWSELEGARRAFLLRTRQPFELVNDYGGTEEFYSEERKRTWDAKTNHEQYVLLQEFAPEQLAERYSKPVDFFRRALEYSKTVETKHRGTSKRHLPPKSKLIQEARRDLTLADALCELVDNSIDRCGFARPSGFELRVVIQLDHEVHKGCYYDNAGGMERDSVFQVFIPGETTSAPDRLKIGSFGFGAKKAIFFLSDGTTVFSALENKPTFYAAIPEGWPEADDWDIEEGPASATPALLGEERPLNGETLITFERLRLAAEVVVEDSELREHLGRTYAELLLGRRDGFKFSITLNGELVEAVDKVAWAAPRGSGAPPRRFRVRRIFEDIEGTGGARTEMEFELLFGLLPGQSKDYGSGIDVYGNYRLFDRNLRQKIGLGRRKGMQLKELGGSAANLLRGKLLVTGPSEGVPWDTNKRTYLTDHPVARFIRDAFEDVYRAYVTAVGLMTGGKHQAKGTSKFLAGTSTDYDDIDLVDLGLIDGLPNWPKDKLPEWQPPIPEPDAVEISGSSSDDDDDYEEEEDEIEFITSPADLSNPLINTLAERYGEDLPFPQQAQKALEDAATPTHLVIRLDQDQINELMSKLGCSTVTELEEAIRKQLISKLNQ